MAVQSFFVILNPPKAGEELPSVVGILRPAKGGTQDDKVVAHSANGIAHFSSGSKTRSLQRPGLDDPHVILNSPKAGLPP